MTLRKIGAKNVDEKLVSMGEIAKYCNVSSWTVNQWRVTGKIPAPVVDEYGNRLWTVSQARQIMQWWATRATPRHLLLLGKKRKPDGL